MLGAVPSTLLAHLFQLEISGKDVGMKQCVQIAQHLCSVCLMSEGGNIRFLMEESL